MDKAKIDRCVAQLAEDGCKAVWSHIDELEAGQSVRGTEGLSAEERRAVAAELRSVMAVYASRCEP